MQLVELLFCVVFFVLPVLGMFAAVIRRVVKEGRLLNKEHEEVKRIRAKRAFRPPVFECPRIMEYQLVESQIQIPLHLTRIKERTHQRAGP